MNEEAGNSARAAEPAASGRFPHLADKRKRRPYLKAGALLLLALIAGIVIGAGGAVIYFKNKKRPPPPKVNEIGAVIMNRMQDTLTITPEEREHLEGIIQSRMEKVDKMRRQVFDEMRDEFDNLSDDVDKVLGPERAERWDKENKRRYGHRYRDMNERRERRGHKGGHHD